jgi:ribosomal-protein-alanine N-acetyltransferase
MPLIEIETARLHLRPFTPDDVADLHRLWTDPLVRKYLWDDLLIAREQAEAVVQGSLEGFAARGFGFWTVKRKGEASLLGFCGFRFFGEPPQVEILYGLAPQSWGRGLATEAAGAILRYGFEECGLERVLAGADPPNAASFRVMERLGMTFAERTQIEGRDAIYYAVTRKGFQPGETIYVVRRA